MVSTRARAVCRISKANAKQRSGRSGRVQEGTCYRLYPKEVFEQLAAHMEPEMRCMPLEAVVLQLKSIGAPPWTAPTAVVIPFSVQVHACRACELQQISPS